MVVNKNNLSGRQKIPIEKIPKKCNLQVTFSKRRSGLFKKASELCTLCGVEIAMIVFSPANKAFSFGHPGVESIIDRYLIARNSLHINSSVNVYKNSNICNLNMRVTQLLDELEIEKKRGNELDLARKMRQREFWWESPIDQLDSPEQLQQLMISLEELKKDFLKHSSKLLMGQAGSSSCLQIVGANYGFGHYDYASENKLAGAASSGALANDAFNLIYPTHEDIFKFIS